MIRRILVTGFEPWGEHRVNSSRIAVEPLHGETIGGARVEVVLLPVDPVEAPLRLLAAADAFGPDALVSFGMRSRGDDAWHVEVIARNVLRMGDSGDAPEGEGADIVAGGSRILPSGLPVARIHGRLLGAGIPVRFSEDAGAFLCNFIFYWSLHKAAEGRLPPFTGFVHVPPPIGPPEAPQNRGVLEEGARIVVEALVAAPGAGV